MQILNYRVALINNMNIENKLPDHRLISNNFETEQKNQLIVDNEMRHEAGQLMKDGEQKNESNVDIAILDTGISFVHPDLDVYKNIRLCSRD